MKRLFDIVVSFFSIIILLPLFLVISLIIVLDSRGGVLYKQTRVGKNNKDFKIFKFRTMFSDSDKKGLLTVGMRDSRITKSGVWLRKYKIDELPQIFNVFIGDMSFVGPRPEVRKYVEMYNTEQLEVLQVRPGITDFASIKYRNENEILAKAKKPEQEYIENIMPEKLKLNLEYINNRSLLGDIKILFKTVVLVLKHE